MLVTVMPATFFILSAGPEWIVALKTQGRNCNYLTIPKGDLKTCYHWGTLRGMRTFPRSECHLASYIYTMGL